MRKRAGRTKRLSLEAMVNGLFKEYTNLIHILWEIGQDPRSENATKGLLSFCQLCTYPKFLSVLFVTLSKNFPTVEINLCRINPPIERVLFKIIDLKDTDTPFPEISLYAKKIFLPKKWKSTELPKYVTNEFWRV